jgi:GTP-binding protein HflX
MNNFPESFLVSSHDSADMVMLREHIINYFLQKQDIIELLVPYEDGAAHSSLRSQTNIIETHSLEKGIFYQIRAPGFIFDRLGMRNYCLSPEQVKELEYPR